MIDKPVSGNDNPSNSQRGIVWHMAGMVLFALMDAVLKHLVTGLPVVEILWGRYVFFFVFGLVLALRLDGRATFKTKAPVLRIARGLALVMETGLFTYPGVTVASGHPILAAIKPWKVSSSSDAAAPNNGDFSESNRIRPYHAPGLVGSRLRAFRSCPGGGKPARCSACHG